MSYMGDPPHGLPYAAPVEHEHRAGTYSGSPSSASASISRPAATRGRGASEPSPFVIGRTPVPPYPNARAMPSTTPGPSSRGGSANSTTIARIGAPSVHAAWSTSGGQTAASPKGWVDPTGVAGTGVTTYGNNADTYANW